MDKTVRARLMNDQRLDTKEVRKFGIVFAALLCILATVHWWRTGHVRAWMYVAGCAVFSAAVIVPVVLKPFVWIWLRVATGISFVVTHVILIVVYYCVITPAGVAMRAMGHDPMKRRFEPENTTYWEDPPDEEVPEERYLKQF